MTKVRSVADYLREIDRYQTDYDKKLVENIFKELEVIDKKLLKSQSKKSIKVKDSLKENIKNERYFLNISYSLLKKLEYRLDLNEKKIFIAEELKKNRLNILNNCNKVKEISHDLKDYKYLNEMNILNKINQFLDEYKREELNIDKLIKKIDSIKKDLFEEEEKLKNCVEEKEVKIENLKEEQGNLEQLKSELLKFQEIDLELFKSLERYKKIEIDLYILEYLNNLFSLDYQLDIHREISKVVNFIKMSNNRMFYRGQSESFAKDNRLFSIVPSLMHRPDVQVNEYSIFQDILRLDNEAFDKQKSYLDIHKEMQHYTEISRVIDITTAALSGLFFAVGELTEIPDKDPCVFMFAVEKENVKRPESDGTQIKLALSTIKDDQRNNLKQEILNHINRCNHGCPLQISLLIFNEAECVKKLSYSVRKNDGVLTKIRMPEKIADIEFVLPNMNNKRIVAQQGAFIAVGLLTTQEEVYEKIEPYLRLPRLDSNDDYKHMVITIDKYYAYQIKLELENLGITKAVMYPDIQKIGQYFKHDLYNR